MHAKVRQLAESLSPKEEVYPPRETCFD